MSQQVIKQPNNLLAIYSSITDTILMWDATEQDVIDWFVEQAGRDARRHAERVLQHVTADEPRKIYYQFTLSWEDAMEMDREHGGEVWRTWGAT